MSHGCRCVFIVEGPRIAVPVRAPSQADQQYKQLRHEIRQAHAAGPASVFKISEPLVLPSASSIAEQSIPVLKPTL